MREIASGAVIRTSRQLADGREILYFDAEPVAREAVDPRDSARQHPVPAALRRPARGVGRGRLAPPDPDVPAARRRVPPLPVPRRGGTPRCRRAITRWSSSRTASRRCPPPSRGTCRRRPPASRSPSCGRASAAPRSSASPASTTASSPNSGHDRARLVVDVWLSGRRS